MLKCHFYIFFSILCKDNEDYYIARINVTVDPIDDFF